MRRWNPQGGCDLAPTTELWVLSEFTDDAQAKYFERWGIQAYASMDFYGNIDSSPAGMYYNIDETSAVHALATAILMHHTGAMDVNKKIHDAVQAVVDGCIDDSEWAQYIPRQTDI